jgi:hypothetical protein
MMAKTHGGSTLARMAMPRPAVRSTPQSPIVKKGTLVASTSNQPANDQLVADEKRGATDKEILVDPNDADKKLHVSTELVAK